VTLEVSQRPFGVNPNSCKVLAICSLTPSAIPPSFALSVPIGYVLGTGVLGNKTSGTDLCYTPLPIGEIFRPYAIV
jgi:hypothetical protein